MRSLTPQQSAALNAAAGYSSWCRVRVLRAGVWHDLSELGSPGLDFLKEAEVSESIEAPVATATVRCEREVHGFSLAPLVTSSPLNVVDGAYAPLLAAGRTFVVETAVVPLGMAPAEWMEAFRGRIDSVDVGGDGATFEGRDYGGGLLQDTYIEAERQYGSDSGVAAEEVMASILSDNLLWPGYARWLASHTYADGDHVLPTAGKGTGFLYAGDASGDGHSGSTEPVWPTVLSASVSDNHVLWYAEAPYLLYTPTSPGWMLGRFLQKGESLMDALSALAQQLGWEVRWKWNSTAAQYLLTFWSPDRDAATPVVTFTSAEYQNLSQVRTALEDVRNAVEVVFSDPADLDVTGAPKRKTVAVEDSASVAALGRRFMRVAEAAASNINTTAEATTLATAALADLKDTPLGLDLEVAYRPDLELGDLVGVEGNGYHFTSTQTGAARALTLTANSSGVTTKLTLQGKPSTSVRRWLTLEQRPTTAPSSPFTGPTAPSGLAAVETAGGFRLAFSPPTTGPKAAAYELHVSKTSGFTPSDSTRRVVGAITEMVVTDLEPGATYYARVVARDAKGNRGSATAQTTLVPRYVEARTLQPQVSYSALPLNSDFEAANTPGAPPDGWEMGSGTWGTDFSLSSDSNSGTNAVQLGPTATLGPKLLSQLFVVYPGTSYAVRGRFKSNEDSAFLSNLATVGLRWYSDASTTISENGFGPAVFDAGDWVTVDDVATAPSTAKFARVVLSAVDNSTTQEIVFDSVRVDVATIPLGRATLPTLLNSFSSAADANIGKAQYYRDANEHVCFMGAVRRAAGAPAAGTVIFTLPQGPSRKRSFAVATDTGAGVLRVEMNGDVTYQSGGVAEFFLDGVRFRLDDNA